ncbi:hypothetical protein Taro_038488 [Colocasia esculenta]|uniref:Uncharacterized protein n=1 Tax=Colocasia esculenta TaxID=4460 RepID=A0A843WNU5_COLES|nr:hypothetical protein [Colocasia esculenta]
MPVSDKPPQAPIRVPIRPFGGGRIGKISPPMPNYKYDGISTSFLLCSPIFARKAEVLEGGC